MKTLELGRDLYLFMFDPEAGGFEGLNFLALVEGGEALFLDTGYAHLMKSALDFVRGLGAVPTGAIVSHYHEDHAGGIPLLGGVPTWGSEKYAASLDRCFPQAERAALAPSRLVRGPETLVLGSHTVELFPLPGHSPDSLGAIVDGRVLYAADTLLLTNEGAPILPSVHARPISLHAESLRKLRSHLDLLFVPGHGAPLADRGDREADLANRLAYIEAIAASPGIGLEEAQRGCEPKFLGSVWHEENCR
jgi:glyoxylase-like metal-dependent hydrolase (beta-lactamase superfamily II)